MRRGGGPVVARASSVTVSGGTKNGLKWTWGKGAATSLADFGDPTQTEDYTMCVYDTAGPAGRRLQLQATVPHGNTCLGKPCWKSTSKGFT